MINLTAMKNMVAGFTEVNSESTDYGVVTFANDAEAEACMQESTINTLGVVMSMDAEGMRCASQCQKTLDSLIVRAESTGDTTTIVEAFAEGVKDFFIKIWELILKAYKSVKSYIKNLISKFKHNEKKMRQIRANTKELLATALKKEYKDSAKIEYKKINLGAIASYPILLASTDFFVMYDTKEDAWDVSEKATTFNACSTELAAAVDTMSGDDTPTVKALEISKNYPTGLTTKLGGFDGNASSANKLLGYLLLKANGKAKVGETCPAAEKGGKYKFKTSDLAWKLTDNKPIDIEIKKAMFSDDTEILEGQKGMQEVIANLTLMVTLIDLDEYSKMLKDGERYFDTEITKVEKTMKSLAAKVDASTGEDSGQATIVSDFRGASQNFNKCTAMIQIAMTKGYSLSLALMDRVYIDVERLSKLFAKIVKDADAGTTSITATLVDKLTVATDTKKDDINEKVDETEKEIKETEGGTGSTDVKQLGFDPK